MSGDHRSLKRRLSGSSLQTTEKEAMSVSTDSITRKMVLSEEAVDRLIAAMEDPTPKREINTHYYEEGIKILEEYSGRFEK